MKWLQDNPLGLALTALCGVFVLLALIMALMWSWPVTVETAGNENLESDGEDSVVTARTLAAISNFQVINEKPVFNESRRPVLEDVNEPDEQNNAPVEVKGAPDLKLTGIIITPNMKIASLTPVDASLEAVMAHEGQALTGEFVGWHVGVIEPRAVVLESRNGRKLELELEVHDLAIKEPPKPDPPAKTAQADDPGDKSVGEDGEPLSRAEQIRQRIAERREQLRMEQEMNQAASGTDNGGAAETSKSRRDYQNAIRAMNSRNKERNGNEN